MSVQTDVAGARAEAGHNWYSRTPDTVAKQLGVDPGAGLPAAKVVEKLRSEGPNALPEEKAKPGWLRFLDEYRSYMQIILIAAAVVSLVVQEWGTAVLLLLLTVLNAVIGLRQKGKAESAMNALRSMMKATARVRRDGTMTEIPAEQVVPGDVVAISAGDQVPADGRIIAASALQIDESALTGESTPAAKDAAELDGDRELGPGDQTNMAFMNTPVTHGSGTMIVTGTGGGTELGRISSMLAATAKEKSPLTKELDRLTLWIAAAAGLTMIVMFLLGRSRGEAWDVLFISAVALAIAAVPEALPTVTQWILSVGGVDLAKRNAIVKELPSVETLAFTSAINSDKTGTLTMNQMTAVEVVDAGDRYTVSGTGYSLEGKVHHAVGSSASIEAAILPYIVASDAHLVDGRVVGDPGGWASIALRGRLWTSSPVWPKRAFGLCPPTSPMVSMMSSGLRHRWPGLSNPHARTRKPSRPGCADVGRAGGKRHGQDEQEAPVCVPRGHHSRPAGKAEARAIRAGDAATARRTCGHAGVGKGDGGQDLRRVRGPGHRRQGGHDQAHHRAGEPAGVPGGCPARPDRARAVADVHAALRSALPSRRRGRDL